MEFQLLEDGFKIIDEQTEANTVFYAYDDIQSIELNNVWYPKLAKWLRVITWILNGVPYFPESYKKANLLINFKKTKLKIWLLDIDMLDKAKRLVDLLNKKTKPKLY